MFSPRRKGTRTAENLEILIGFLGFFAAVLVVIIIAMEARGGSALVWSPVLLLVVLAIRGLWRVRRRLPDTGIERRMY